MAVVYADSTWLSWSQQSLCSCVAMQQFLKFYEAAHAYVEQSGYADALVYFDSALRELERRQSTPEQNDPYTRGKVQSLLEAVKEEVAQVRAYERKLHDLSRCVYSGKAPSSSNYQWAPKEAVQRHPHREQPAADNNQWAPREPPAPPARRQVERPSRAPVKPPVPRAQRQPDVKGAGPKVNSGRGNSKAKPKAQQQDAEPWVSWDGQDKELAANLANDIMDSSPGIRWEDIAGLQDAKRILQACSQEAMVLPLLKPELFVGIRKPVKGVLLFGPPGTGKTLLAKALATECETTFFTVSSSTLASKWRGESERMVRVMFAMAHAKAPATIFIDEVDALCSSRGGGGDNDAGRRVKTEILVQINGIQAGGSDGGRVMVMGATNFPWDLDEALRRRLEKRVYIPLPGHDERKVLFSINLKEVSIAHDCDFDRLAKMGEGYSGDDITNICRDAAMNGLRRAIEGKDMSQIRAMGDDEVHEPIRMQDFLQAFDKVRPSVGQADIEKHAQWKQEYGST